MKRVTVKQLQAEKNALQQEILRLNLAIKNIKGKLVSKTALAQRLEEEGINVADSLKQQLHSSESNTKYYRDELDDRETRLMNMQVELEERDRRIDWLAEFIKKVITLGSEK